MFETAADFVHTSLLDTWGADGRDMPNPSESDETQGLEGEDKDAIWKYGTSTPEAPPAKFSFEANYGWPPSPPMLHTVATYHAQTITELKFCGAYIDGCDPCGGHASVEYCDSGTLRCLAQELQPGPQCPGECVSLLHSDPR